jgi:uncharacterized OB-fold protein
LRTPEEEAEMPATTQRENTDVFIYEGQVYIPNTYTAGAVGTRVLESLRDKKRILGMRCSTCNRVVVPARSTCNGCFGQMDEWVEVSDLGTLQTYTVVYEPNIVQPVQTPVLYGIVQLDGADNGFVHLLGEVDIEDLRIGMRVRAVYRNEGRGNLLDIRYFRPLK